MLELDHSQMRRDLIRLPGNGQVTGEIDIRGTSGRQRFKTMCVDRTRKDSLWMLGDLEQRVLDATVAQADIRFDAGEIDRELQRPVVAHGAFNLPEGLHFLDCRRAGRTGFGRNEGECRLRIIDTPRCVGGAHGAGSCGDEHRRHEGESAHIGLLWRLADNDRGFRAKVPREFSRRGAQFILVPIDDFFSRECPLPAT